MPHVLQVIEIFVTSICHIFEFCWLPKVTSALSKQPTEHDDDGNNNKIDPYIIVTITIMICRSLGENAGHFWQPAEFENVANPDFDNLKHLQNHGHLPLTEASIIESKEERQNNTDSRGDIS